MGTIVDAVVRKSKNIAEDRKGSTALHLESGSHGVNRSDDTRPRVSPSARAIDEIEGLLSAQDGCGHVWIRDWNQRCRHALGSFRQFLESRPDLYVVVPEAGGKFRVARANSRRESQGYGSDNIERAATRPRQHWRPPHS